MEKNSFPFYETVLAGLVILFLSGISFQMYYLSDKLDRYAESINQRVDYTNTRVDGNVVRSAHCARIEEEEL